MGDNTIYSDFVMAAVTDDFFRWYTNWEMASWADGQVDAPTGWFAVCNIDRSDVAEYTAESGDPTISRHVKPTPGWFLVQIDNLGMVYTVSYEGLDGSRPVDEQRRRALADFNRLSRMYYKWWVEVPV